MIHKRMIVATFVVFSAAALAAHAPLGAAQPQNPPRSDPQTPTAATQQVTTTLVGCLYREEQVPGRKPDIAERAGILEDYILADATIPSPSKQAPPGATAGATGTSGTLPPSGNMYKVEKIPDERLKALVGKRVEVTGRIDPQKAPAPDRPATGKPTEDRSLSRDLINLPEFEAASIREVSGTCPATPAPPK